MSRTRRISPRRKQVRVQRRRVFRRIAGFVERAAAAAVFHALALDPTRPPPDPCADRNHLVDSRGYCVNCHRLIEED